MCLTKQIKWTICPRYKLKFFNGVFILKKVLVFLLAGLLTLSFSSCGNSNTESSGFNSQTSVSVGTTVPETTEQENLKINIPYSCFDSVSKDDCILTRTDMENGILSKELSDNGGIILTVDNNKYDDLLEYAKNQFVSEINRLKQSNADIEKIEYSDTLDTISLYFSHTYFYPDTQANDSNNGLPVADAPVVEKPISWGSVFEDSIYYQSLIKKTETELLTCNYYFIDSSNGNVEREYVFPEE